MFSLQNQFNYNSQERILVFLMSQIGVSLQILKNQINLKLRTNSRSERDYIVFRPKCNLVNPLLRKKNINMSSIFQLQNRRKNQIFMLKIRTNLKQSNQKDVSIQENLHIQRCKTFRKLKRDQQRLKQNITFKNTKNQDQTHLKSIKSDQIRQKNLIKQKTKHHSKKRQQNKIQKKNMLDIFYQTIESSFSQKQKENHLKKVKKPFNKSYIENQAALSISLQGWNIKQIMCEQKTKVIRKQIQCHKRFQTQIPPLFLNYQQSTEKENPKGYVKKTEQNYVFKPWQTRQIFQKQYEIFED